MIERKRHRYSGCDSLLSSLVLAAGTRAGFPRAEKAREVFM